MLLGDNLRDVGVFVAVVNAGSFTGAARELGLAKSTVSKQVRALEDRLGARLLDRTTRSMRLTDVGAAFFDRCSQILASVEEAELAVTSLQDTPRGRLRISAPMSFGQRFVGGAIADFLWQHPDVEVTIELEDRTVDVIDEGFDVAIRVGVLEDSSLIARKLVASRMIVVGSPSYFELRGEPRVPDELRDHDCLIYSYQRTGDSWQFEGDDGPIFVKVSGRLRANNGDLLRDAACAGVGLAVLPEFIVEHDLAAGRLRSVLGDFSQQRNAVFAVYPTNRHLSAKVRLFVDLLTAHLLREPAA